MIKSHQYYDEYNKLDPSVKFVSRRFVEGTPVKWYEHTPEPNEDTEMKRRRVNTDNQGRPIPSPPFVPPTGEFVSLKKHNGGSVLKKRTIVTETVTEEYEVVKPQRDLSNVGHVVYFIKCNEFTKIGYTNNIQERMTVLQVGNPYELEIVDLIECDTQLQAQQLEKELHQRYQASHIRGEWYKL